MLRGAGFHGRRSAPVYVLGQLSVQPAAAYGLRRLSPTWAGPAINVRRSSDNAATDIGFDGRGGLNTTALLAFVGSGAGNVVTWYDQSGNARHATQATPTAQPIIVSNGVVVAINGRPAVTPSNGPLVTPQFVCGASQFTANAVVQMQPSGTGQRVLAVVASSDGNDFGSTTSAIPMLAQDPSSMLSYRNGLVTAASISGIGVVTSWFDAATGDIAVNGVAQSASYAAKSLGAQIALYVGGSIVGGAQFMGNLGEMVWFHAALSNSDRQSLEHSQGAYYGITVA